MARLEARTVLGWSVVLRRSAHATLELAFAAEVAVAAAELLERLRLDLARAFARDAELVADDVERAGAAVLDAEAQLDDRALARRQDIEGGADALTQELPRRFLFGRRRHDVCEDAAERAFFLFADRRLEGDDGLTQGAGSFSHLVGRHAHHLRKLGCLGLAAEALE